MSDVDVRLRLPWPNRRRPFVALHVVRYGTEIHRGRHRPYWYVGLMAGRQFMPTNDNGWSKWFEVRRPWWSA